MDEIDKYTSVVDFIGDGTSQEAKSFLIKSFKDKSMNTMIFNFLLTFSTIVNYVDIDGRTIFHYVAIQSNPVYIKTLQTCIESKTTTFEVNVNMQDINGITPLMLALRIDTIQRLIELGADPFLLDTQGRDIIVYILLNSALIARSLLEYILSKFPDLAQSSIVQFIKFQQIDLRCLETLIKYKFNINQRDQYGNTLLHKLAKDDDGNIDLIINVISHGADPYSTNIYGTKPVHIMLQSTHYLVREYANELYQRRKWDPNRHFMTTTKEEQDRAQTLFSLRNTESQFNVIPRELTQEIFDLTL